MKVRKISKQYTSQRRLNLVWGAAVFLSWVLSLSYILSWIWLGKEYTIIQLIITPLAKIEPMLLTPDFHLSPTTGGLLVLLDVLPVIVSSLIFFLVGLFFLRLSSNALWTTLDFRILWIAGILNMVSPMLYSLSGTLQGLAVSMDLPAGKRIFRFSIGLSTSGVHDVVVGLIICTFAWFIRKSIKTYEENSF